MAKPRIFVSSTYYDLKHVRASLEVFIESLGFEPILAEYGTITYDPSQPLDESCYREAQSSDVLVLIVGGRYGSPTSMSTPSKQREDEFESVTRREFSKAHDADIPVYVLIEQGVFAEYQTYLRNKENSTISYAHVDSTKVFRFIEFIYSKQRNNPVQPFEKGSDIETWLKDQWAGMFQELLRQRKDNSRFSDLASQIRQLEAVNATLKSYLESVLETVSPEKSTAIIEKENKSLSRSQALENVRKNPWFEHVQIVTNLTPDQVLDLHLAIESVSDIIPKINENVADPNAVVAVLEPLSEFDEARRDFSRVREALKQRSVRFTKKSLDELAEEVKAKRRDKRFSQDEFYEVLERPLPSEEECPPEIPESKPGAPTE